MKKGLLPLVILLACSLMFSCDNSGDDDLTPEEQVDEMLTDEQEQLLADLGMDINGGGNPPNITGYYRTNDLDCTGDTTGLFYQNLNYYWNFHDQSGKTLKLDYFNDYGDVATAQGAFIFGAGNDFTVYMEVTGQFEATGITYTQVSLFSGTLTAAGIQNFQEGFIMTGKTGDDDDIYLMPVNAARVYEEGDGLAGKIADPGFDIAANNRAFRADIQESILAMRR